MFVISSESVFNGFMESINLKQAVFNLVADDQFDVRVVHNLKEACELVGAGFEYVTEMDARFSGSGSKRRGFIQK